MSKRPRWLVFASLAAVVLLAVAVVGALRSAEGPDSLGAKIGILPSEGSQEAQQAAQATTEPGTDARTETGSGTGATSAKKKAAPKDALTPPTTTDTSSEAWKRYVAETKAVVENNEAGLKTAVDEFMQALIADDGAALEEMLAPDEGSTGYGEELVGEIPAIQTSTPLGTVNVFKADEVTIYFAYALVTWEDAGLVSEHTVPIMFRFVNGTWVVTALGDAGGDMTFVQSLTL